MTSMEQEFEQLARLLTSNDLSAEPSEIHGLLTGMLAGGMALDSQGWREPMQDFINNGAEFSRDVVQAFNQLFSDIDSQTKDTDYTFSLLLPEENAPLGERAFSLVLWVQGFLAGFAINKKDFSSLEDEVGEIFKDFSEIARMDTEMEDTDENEQAFEEILEYVRISAMICYTEFHAKPETKQSNILH